VTSLVASLTKWGLCQEAAARAGHDLERASQCKDGELECLFCPFDDQPQPGALQQNDLRFALGHWDSLGMPQ